MCSVKKTQTQLWKPFDEAERNMEVTYDIKFGLDHRFGINEYSVPQFSSPYEANTHFTELP